MEDKRKRILDLVKKGTLSTDEALTLLEALDKETKKGNTGQSETYAQNGPEAGSGKKERDQTQNFNEAKEKLFDLVGGALKKVKDFDFQISQSVEVPHVFQQHKEAVDDVEIDIANGHVAVRQWDQEDIRVECRAKVFRTNDRDEARSFLLNNSSFSVEDGRLSFTTQSKWMKVDADIYLPPAQYRKINLRTFSGNVNSKEIKAEKMNIKTLHGKVLIEQGEMEKVDVETGNGSIEFDANVFGQVDAQTMNGDIRSNGTFHKADLESFNGNIQVGLTAEADTLHTKTVSGNIDITVPEHMTVQGEGKTNFGSFALELDGVDQYDERKELIQKLVRFSRKGEAAGNLYIFADAKTGSIFIKEKTSEAQHPDIRNTEESTEQTENEEK
ncbi:DUF4097 family beta strand repeat-containing protein [Heyndrickxia acidiproducens]|uniref:DUF4097 family beta strand repeat-containing protein n=1 Tax=Heyndrickxia acidiproducens TaxID=1121084 RepID=UPI00035F96F6|nr:DUF4097 domain-containing protein [Heyndrickxia acidiproducens]